jgi:hypothetical protein
VLFFIVFMLGSFVGFPSSKTYTATERTRDCVTVERIDDTRTRSIDLCGSRYTMNIGDRVQIDETRNRPPKVFAVSLVFGFLGIAWYLWWIARRFKFGPYRPKATSLESSRS